MKLLQKVPACYQTVYSNYIEHLTVKGHRPRGITGFSIRLRPFFTYLDEKELTMTEITIIHAQEYQGWIQAYGQRKGHTYTNATVKTYITPVLSFFDFLKGSGIVHTNPFKEIRRAKIEKTLPTHLPKEKDLHRFLKELSCFWKESGLTAKITRFKVWVVAELMYATGLRIAEVASLKPEDIDFEKGLVKVHEGKMGISRLCYLSEYAVTILKLYCDEFRELTFNAWNRKNDHLLFGVKWSNFEKTVNKMLRKVSTELGYPAFTSHQFRHCLGFHLLRSGCDIRYIQAILGHKLLRNTEVYTKVDKEDLKKVFDTYHPRSFSQGKQAYE